MSGATPGPEDMRARLAEAAASPLEDEIAALRAATLALQQAARDNDADRDRLTAPAERAMADARNVLYVALSGELPPPEPVVLPDGRDELLAALAGAIESLIAHVQEADPAQFGAIPWTNERFGELDWRQWLVLIRMDLEKAAAGLQT